MNTPTSDLDPEVLVFSLKKRYTGVSATVNALVPVQSKSFRLAYVGEQMPNKFKPIRFFDALLISRRSPADRPFRIWHLRRNNEMFLGIIARYVLRMPIRLVFTSAAQRRHSLIPRWLISKMDAVICTSPRAAEFIDNCRAVVPHGVDLIRFEGPANKLQAWSASGLPGKWGVGLFGRVRPEKGTDIFVDAMISVLSKFPEACAVVAGLVQPRYQAYMDALKDKIEAAGLSDRLIFLGEIDPAEVGDWYQRCLICVACPRYEAFGLTLFEAGASECAVVGTRTGAFELLARPGLTGDITRIGDVHGLEHAISDLLADIPKTIEKGKSARLLVREKFSVEAEANGIAAVYTDIFYGRLSKFHE